MSKKTSAATKLSRSRNQLTEPRKESIFEHGTITATQASKEFGPSETFFRRLAADRKIEHTRVGRAVLLSRRTIVDYFESCKVPRKDGAA